ncbi:unnamed protein product [Brugia timori]|uniref:Uncharacterized protein n=1 Tax=Brugia timori TaxID=42155 RepID=A0A0R3QAC7_9BILA|nr:unnamed protein product [Brugia timori]
MRFLPLLSSVDRCHGLLSLIHVENHIQNPQTSSNIW